MALPLLLKMARALSPAPDTARPRLITIGFSHFSEKARWALDLSPWALEYDEEMHYPALHLSSTLDTKLLDRVVTWSSDSQFHKLLQARYSSEKIAHRKEITSVPKLILPKSYIQKTDCYNVLPNKKQSSRLESFVVSGGSSGILKALSDVFPREMGHLYPASHLDQVIELEHMLDTQFATAVTDWDFANMLLTGAAFHPSTGPPDSARSTDNAKSIEFLTSFLATQPVPQVEKIIYKLMFNSVLKPLMIKANNVHADNAAPAKAQIHKIFTLMDTLLARNNPTGNINRLFLLGTERITAADISFASFACGVLLLPQTAGFFPSCERICDSYPSGDKIGAESAGVQNLVNFAIQLRAKYRSAQYVCDLYETQRFSTLGYTFYSADSVGKGGKGGKVREVVPRVR